MSIVYLISVDELMERTTIDKNVETKIIESSIFDAQEIDLQNVLGTRLLNKLKTDIIAGTITGVYKTLLDDYIYNYLIKTSERRALLFMWIKFRNKGLMQQNSENSNPVDFETFNKVRSELLNDIEFYENKLKAYLLDEQSNLPEFANWNSDNKWSNSKPDQNDSYFSGIHLEPNRFCRGSAELDYLQSIQNKYIV